MHDLKTIKTVKTWRKLLIAKVYGKNNICLHILIESKLIQDDAVYLVELIFFVIAGIA